MKTQLRFIVALLFYLNVILTIELFRRSTDRVDADNIYKYPSGVQKVDIVKVAGRWLAYGNGLPMEK